MSARQVRRGGWAAAAAVLRHPLLLLVLALSLFFYKEVYLGKVFSAADLLFAQQPWQTVAPAGFTHPSNPLRSDDANIGFPHRADIAADVKKFGLVFWSSHTLVGEPQTYALHDFGAWVYPPMLGMLALPPGAANNLVQLPILLIGALSMYLLLGLMVSSPWARLFGAIAWGLNGYNVVWLSAFTLPLVMAVVPLVVYCMYRFLEQRHLGFGILGALLFAWSFFFGYPPANVIMAVFLAIFAIAWWVRDPRRRLGRAAAAAGLFALGGGAAMVAILPTYADLASFAGKLYRGVMPPMPLRFVAAYWFPNIAGNPIATTWRASLGNYCEFIAYDGLLPLLLSGTGVILAAKAWRRLPSLLLGAIAVGVVSFLLVYPPVVVNLMSSLPLFDQLNPDRWQIGIDLALAIVGAYGLDQLVTGRAGRLGRYATVASCAAVGAVALAIVYLKRHEIIGVHDFVSSDFKLRLAILAVAALVVVLLARTRRPWLGAAAVALLFFDLFTFGVDFNPAVDPAAFYPPTPALTFLASHSAGYRVLPVEGAYEADVFGVYGIDVIPGYDHYRDQRLIDLLGDNMSPGERQFWAGHGILLLSQQVNLDSAVWNLLNVKYAYYPYARQGLDATPSSHWRRVYSAADGAIYENLLALPAQYLVRTPGAAPEAISHLPARPDSDAFSVAGPGTLVWSRPYRSDLRVTVDGRRAATGAYAGYLLSTELPPGSHNVSMSFEHTAYDQGALISALSVLLLGAIGAIGGRRRWLARRAAAIAPGPGVETPGLRDSRVGAR